MRYQRMKDLRQDKDLYQKDIAKILNLNQQAYSRYETGNKTITTELLVKLALFYNTSTDYILGLTNIKEPYPKRKEK